MIVRTVEELERVASEYAAFSAFAFDVESRGTRPQRMKPDGKTPDPDDKPALDSFTNEVTWVALAGPGRYDVIPMLHPHGEMILPARKEKVQERDYNLDNLTKKGMPRLKTRTVTLPPEFGPAPEQLKPIDVFAALEPLFFPNRERTIIGHNLKFDIKSVAKYYGGRLPQPNYFDTLVAQHIVNENLQRKGLKELTEVYFKYRYNDLGKFMEDSSFFDAATYAGRDARYTWLLYRELRRRLDAKKLWPVMDLDMDTLEVLAHMELTGAPLDDDGRQRLDLQLRDQIEIAKGDLWRAADKKWNLDSQPEQGWFVYDVRNHRAKSLTKGGKPSTSKEALEKIARKDKHVQRLMDYKGLTKLRSTYVTGIGHAAHEDGRVRANFTLHVTVTGRLSCTEPNLQNIPRPGEANATAIRGMFVAPAYDRLIVADYSQQEYRVLAHFSRDERYLDIFLNHPEIDPHVMTAVELFELSVDEVTKELRTVAKNTGFAVVYGAGPEQVALMSGVSVDRAKEVMNRHQRTFPGIYQWINQTLRDARQSVGPKGVPYVKTLHGRRRRLYELRAPDRSIRGRAERQAINFIIQGTSAEITKKAMVRYHKAAPPQMPLILSVHDELVALAPEDRAEEAKLIMEEAMVGADMQALLDVPLTADAKIVSRWSDAK